MNQYIKYPIAKLISWCYHPCDMGLELGVDDAFISSASLEEKYTEAKNRLDLNLFLENGDGPKFIGLLSAAEPANEEWWNTLKKYWYGRYFVRNTKVELMKTAVNFSGDQISGMLEAIWLRHKTVGLTIEETAQLEEIWESTIFEGDKYKFKHPFVADVDRGWLMSSMGLGNEVLQLLAFLAVGYKIFGTEKYKKEYDKVLKENKALLCCTDICIWFGNLYGAAWYDEHSQMSFYCVGYDVTKDDIFKTAAKQLFVRYQWNPEIVSYYFKYAFIDAGYKYYWPGVFLSAYDFDKKGSGNPDELNTKTYFSLRSFKFVKMSPKVLLPNNRTSLYLWETKDIEAVAGDQFKNATIDFIHLYSLIKG